MNRLFKCLSSAVIWIAISHPVQAQISPDSTLPNSSIVDRNGNTFNITGGTAAGNSLFHSFEEFSVPRNSIAHFQNASEIRNIFSRITGSSASEIDGIIRANGTANLFLLNPNGILFGRGAELNIGGSFLATTADRINFQDGAQFRSNGTQTSPLLTVSAPIGLQFGRNSGAIHNQSIATLLDRFGNPVLDSNGEAFFGGLQVAPGRTIALIGGDISLSRAGAITAIGGRIELGSVADSSFVELNPTANGWNLDYEAVTDFRDISLLQFATVDASGDRGGAIQIRGRNVTLSGRSLMLSNTLNSQNGRAIEVQASRLSLAQDSSILSLTEGSGQAGNITIAADQLVARTGGQIGVRSIGMGAGGRLLIRVSDSIDLANGMIINGEWIPSGLFAQTEADGSGGNIRIFTNALRISEGAQISTTTFGSGEAGSIGIQASTVEIADSARTNRGDLFVDRGLPISSGIYTSAEEDSSGNGGNLSLFVDRISLRDGGVLQTTTFAAGDAGNLTIQAADLIEVIGTDAEGLFPSSLVAASGGILGVVAEGVPTAIGRGGTITIHTGELRVQNGAAIAVGSLNRDEDQARGAGNLRIQAEIVTLFDQGRIITETASGNGGSAILNVENAIVLRRNSQISTTAGVAGSGGNGGDIRINTDFILSTLPEDNDITANAFTGNGGNVTIAAEGILGIAPQARLTDASDITASSEFGNSGAIVITNPTADPSQGLVALPANLIDASRQIAQSCGSGAARQPSEFVITGRGGLPPSPIDSRSSAAILSQWATLSEAGETAAAQAPSVPAIVEAQGWVIGANGEVNLVAAAPIAPAQTTIACR